MRRLFAHAFAVILSFGLVHGLAERFAHATTTEVAQSPKQKGQGESRVDQFYGSFHEKVPIEVPAYHGIEPTIELTYDSSLPNGVLGTGWRLTVASFIQRASHGRGSPSYTPSDIFLLDGEEMVSCATGSTSPSCTTCPSGRQCWSTKLEGYSRIAHDPATDLWTVTDKSGARTEYAAVMTTGSAPFRYAPRATFDTHGNSVRYTYWCDGQSDCYLNGIQYNGTVISFFLETRPDPVTFATGASLANTRFRLKSIDVAVSGTRARAYALQYSVSPTSGNSTLASVRQFGRDAVVDGAGNITGGTALPPITFGWPSTPNGTTLPGYTAPVLGAVEATGRAFTRSDQPATSTRATPRIFIADFNGDGRKDYMWLPAGVPANCGWLVAYSTGTGFTTPSCNAPALPYRELRGMPTWSDVPPPPGNAPPYSPKSEYVADFDGDGKADYMWRPSGGDGRWLVAYSTGSGFVVPDYNAPALPAKEATGVYPTAALWGFLYFYPPAWTMAANGPPPQYVGDFNGDGKADYMWNPEGGDGRWLVAYSTGRGFTLPSYAQPALPAMDASNTVPTHSNRWVEIVHYRFVPLTPEEYIADFNGDGKDDFLWSPGGNTLTTQQDWLIAYSTGTGFTNPSYLRPALPATDASGTVSTHAAERYYQKLGLYWYLRNPVKPSQTVADFNGDGKADLAFMPRDGDGRWLIAYSTGSGLTRPDYRQPALPAFVDGVSSHASKGFFTPDLAWHQIEPSEHFGDMNGDGRADVMWQPDGGDGRWLIAYGTTTGLTTPTYANPALPARDATGAVLTASPVGFAVPAINPVFTAYSRNQFVADFSGDGKADFMWMPDGGDGRWLLSTSTSGDELVQSVTNGIGGTTRVAYAPSSVWQNTNLPYVEHTVASTSISDGRGQVATTTYAYAGGLYDALDGRFLGFHYQRATLPCNPEDGVQCPFEETWFHQDYGSLSKPAQTRRSDGAGHLLTSSIYEYTGNGGTVPYTSLLTGKWEYVFDGTGGTACPGANCKRHYTQYAYDTAGNYVSGAGKYGNVTSSVDYGDYDTAGDELTTLSYYAPNLEGYVVDKVAVEERLAGGKLLSMRVKAYDGAAWTAAPTKGDVTVQLDWLDTASGYASKHATYDPYGNPLTLVDEMGNTTTYAYDTTYHAFQTNITNALGQVTSTKSWDPACGVAIREQGPNGADDVTTTTHDALCRATLEIHPLGAFTRTTYVALGDPANQQILVETPPADGTTLAQWRRSYYDGLGRIYRTETKGPQTIVKQTTFNPRGKVATETEAYYLGTTTGNTVTTTHDALDRPRLVSNTDGSHRTMSYGPWTVTTTDELGHPQTSVFDAHQKEIARRYVIGGVPRETTYRYDGLERLVGLSDASGNLWSYDVDSLGRRTAVHDPDRGSSTYTYRADGKLVRQVDAKGQATTFGYDALGRKISETTLAGTAQARTSAWNHDEPRAGYSNVGKLTSIADTTGSTRYDYDLLGRQTHMVKVIDATTYPFASGFDAGGRLKWTTYPDGSTSGTPGAPLTYDAAGRPLGIPGIVTSATYAPWGAVASIHYANGAVSTYAYNGRRMPMNVSTTHGATTLQDLRLTRDAEGKVTSIASSLPSDGWSSFAYDSLDRLISATNATASADDQTWTYDAVGNLTQNSRIGTYTYPAQGPTSVRPHAVTNAGSISYAYDANGNLTRRGSSALTWDGKNRLTSAGDATFEYDATDARVKKTSGATTSYYVTPSYRVRNGIVTRHVALGKLPVATIVGGVASWLHPDHLGSTHVVTDAAGTSVQRLSHRPYGERFKTATAREEETDFLGERLDAESGLLYMRSRYYDPVLCRFTAADDSEPATESVGVNRYAYALNNPMRFVDDGHEAIDSHVASLVPAQAGVHNVNGMNYYRAQNGQIRPATTDDVKGSVKSVEGASLALGIAAVAINSAAWARIALTTAMRAARLESQASRLKDGGEVTKASDTTKDAVSESKGQLVPVVFRSPTEGYASTARLDKGSFPIGSLKDDLKFQQALSDPAGWKPAGYSHSGLGGMQNARLGDPRFSGMYKMEYNRDGASFHLNWNPVTGETADPKIVINAWREGASPYNGGGQHLGELNSIRRPN